MLKNPVVKYCLLFLLIQASVTGQNDCLTAARSLSNIDSSIKRIEACISDGIQDTALYVKTICHLSSLYNRKSQYVKSEKKLNAIIPRLQSAERRSLLGQVYNQLGNTYKLSHEIAPALNYYLKAVDIFNSEGNKEGLVRVYTDLAEYYRALAKFNKAKLYVKQALHVYSEGALHDTLKLLRIYNRYAAIENETSSDSAIHYSLIALDLARKAGDKNSQAISLNEIGFFLKNRLVLDSAMKCYRSAIQLWTEIGADADAAHGMFNLASLMSHNYFPKRSIIPQYENIIRLVKQKQVDYPLDQVYFELSNCYFFLGDSLACYKTRQDFFSALIQKKQKIFDAQVDNIREKYENEKYKAEISKVSSDLKESEMNLDSQKRENQIVYISLGALSVLIIVIAFLAKKISRSNKALKIKNKEKDTLIQEIHHRVKNNLQFVSSLINMQINSSKTSLEVDSLSDASRRIRSMALVHEMLYNQDDLEGIEIRKYLTELISSINDIVNSQKIPISFNIECETMMFETSKAIALGMITSELVSNSIKYAFENTAKPQIKIRLCRSDNNSAIEFTVRDNGKGLKSESANEPGKLGMRLISIFSRQMKGEYTFNNDNGLVFTLRFNDIVKNGKSESAHS